MGQAAGPSAGEESERVTHGQTAHMVDTSVSTVDVAPVSASLPIYPNLFAVYDGRAGDVRRSSGAVDGLSPDFTM